MKPVQLPASTEPWNLKLVQMHGAVFLIAASPNQHPVVIGRTEQGELFARKLTFQEEGLAG